MSAMEKSGSDGGQKVAGVGESGNGKEDSSKEAGGEKKSQLLHHPEPQKTLEVEEVEEVPIDVNATEVDFAHSRLTDTSVFSFLKAVRSLNLRRNLIKEIRGLSSLVTLVSLELYDNQISSCEGLEDLVNLEYLDLSYNRLTHICHLDSLRKLKRLYFVHNRIGQIQGLENLWELELLELGDNKLRKIEGISHLSRLQRLFLGKNKIRRLEGLPPNLHTLSIQANRITVVENLDGLNSLRQLFISENGLSAIGPGLKKLPGLQILDLAVNFITALPPQDLAHLQDLQDFWFNDNRVGDWNELSVLTSLPKLRTLYLHGNPIQHLEQPPPKDDAQPQLPLVNPDYRRKVLILLPKLTRLDSIPTNAAKSYP